MLIFRYAISPLLLRRRFRLFSPDADIDAFTPFRYFLIFSLSLPFLQLSPPLRFIRRFRFSRFRLFDIIAAAFRLV
jgi:hypothetical protein